MAIGGLGSGLDFLFDENTAEVPVKRTLRLSEIEPNREQPRKTFSEEAISALADSIRQYGMLQPILVRPYGMTYQIVAGERLASCKSAGTGRSASHHQGIFRQGNHADCID